MNKEVKAHIIYRHIRQTGVRISEAVTKTAIMTALSEIQQREEFENICVWYKYGEFLQAPKEHKTDNSYWRLPANAEEFKYCPYCSKRIKVEEGNGMIAKARVHDADDDIVGYIVDNSFLNYDKALEGIKDIKNLSVTKNGVIKAKRNYYLSDITMREYCNSKLEELRERAPFVRDIQKKLESWASKHTDKVLYLKGPRQVGKTTELLRFGYTHYDYVVYVNLADSAIKSIFTKYIMQEKDIAGYCREANFAVPKKQEKVILIIDEIQTSSEVYNKLTELKGALGCAIAITGSNLGVLLNREEFEDTGITYKVELLPMTFKEFTKACDVGHLLTMQELQTDKLELKHKDKLRKLYNVYLEIGGYPDVVLEYTKTEGIFKCNKVVQRVFTCCTEEVLSYFEGANTKLLLEGIYKAVMVSQLTDESPIKLMMASYEVTEKEVADIVDVLEYIGILEKGEGTTYYFTDLGLLSYMMTVVPITESDKRVLKADTFERIERRT